MIEHANSSISAADADSVRPLWIIGVSSSRVGSPNRAGRKGHRPATTIETADLLQIRVAATTEDQPDTGRFPYAGDERHTRFCVPHHLLGRTGPDTTEATGGICVKIALPTAPQLRRAAGDIEREPSPRRRQAGGIWVALPVRHRGV